jgi:hypothetical protein
MIKKLSLLSLLLLSNCYRNKTAAEIQAEQEARARIEAQAQSVQISKEEPAGCTYVTALNFTQGDMVMNEPNTYEAAIQKLKFRTAQAGGNTAVIDSAIAPRDGVWNFQIVARAFKCP